MKKWLKCPQNPGFECMHLIGQSVLKQTLKIYTVESLRPDRARGRESPRGPKPACRIGPAHFPRHQKPPFMQTPTTIRKLSVQKPEHILLLFRTILVKYRKSIEARSLL